MGFLFEEEELYLNAVHRKAEELYILTSGFVSPIRVKLAYCQGCFIHLYRKWQVSIKLQLHSTLRV